MNGSDVKTIPQRPPRIATIAWILYDFANTAYSMNVVSLYFGTWIIISLNQSDLWVSLANSISMIFVALTMPVLGDWSDRKGKKIISLFVFTSTCILGTVALGVLGTQMNNVSLIVPLAILIFIAANYGYQGGLVFYNSLMPAVSTPKTIGRVSGYGVALGYLGSIAGLSIAGIFVDGNFYGIQMPGISAGGAPAAFIPTAILFFVFALPIFIFVKEPPLPAGIKKEWNLKDSYARVLKSIVDTQRHPGLLRFLVAKLFYEDSIQTIIIFMGVYAQAVVGFSLAETKQFFVLVIPSAIVGSALCGIMTDHYGPKRTLTAVLLLWIVSLNIVIFTSSRTIFWISGAFIGALLGSTWTSARPLLITLVPKENLGEFFGLYALSGKVAAILGPLVWSSVAFAFSRFGNVIKYKASTAALMLIMILGLIVLQGVPDLHKRLKGGQM